MFLNLTDKGETFLPGSLEKKKTQKLLGQMVLGFGAMRNMLTGLRMCLITVLD